MHTELSASLPTHFFSLFSVFAAEYSTPHLWSQTGSLNPLCGWESLSTLWEVKIISDFSNRGPCFQLSFSCCIATSAEDSTSSEHRLEQEVRGKKRWRWKCARGGQGLTAVVSDGEVGALTGQAESEGSSPLVFICGCQYPNHLRRGKN